jgi:small conductance mechanosensitive channel
VIFISFWVIFRLTRPALARILSGAGFERALESMLLNVYRFTLLTFGTIMAVNQLGINVGAALAGLGVVGLTIGFAAKDTLSNIMAGFLIFWDKPFRMDDWVTLGENYGKVAEVTMRTTRLVTWNNTLVIIPNETVINQVLVNHSTGGHTRVEVPVTAPVNGDISSKREAILRAIGAVEGVLKEPPPAVVVKAISAASMDLIIQAWISSAEQQRPVFFRILEAAKPALDRFSAAGAQ